MISTCINLILIMAFNCIFYALGRLTFRAIRFNFNSLGEEIIFSYGIGLAEVGYVTFVLGLFSFLYPVAFKYLFGILFVISLIELWKFFRKYALPAPRQIGSLARLEVFLICVMFFTGFCILIRALAPPGGSDPASYWLGLPKIYIDHHKIIHVNEVHQSSWPFLLPMVYMFGMLLYSDVLAQLMHFSLSIGCLFLVYLLARKYFSRRVSLFACAVFISMPLFRSIAGGAYVDFGICFYSLLSIIAFLNWFSGEKEEHSFILSAIFCGIAQAIKITAVAICALIFPGILIKLFRRKRKVKYVLVSIKKIFLFSCVVAVVSFPWYLRSYLYSGNPVYPFLPQKAAVMGGFLNISGEWASIYQEKEPPSVNLLSGKKLLKLFYRMIRLPWDLTITGGREYLMLSMGPFFLAFIPLLVFIRGSPKIIWGLLLGTLAFIYLWAFSPALETRYLLPIFPVACIIAAYSVGRLIEKGDLFSKALLALFLVPLLIGAFLALRSCTFGYGGFYNRLPVVFGKETSDEFHSRTLNYYDACRYINQNLPSTAKVIILWQRDNYYLDRDFVYGDPYLQAINYRFRSIDYNNISSSGDLLRRLHELGVTHVFENEDVKRMKNSTRYYSDIRRVQALHEDLKAKYLRLIFSKNRTNVYEIDYSSIKSRNI